MPVEAGHHAQLRRRRRRAAQRGGTVRPSAAPRAGAERQFVARRELAALEAAERAERVGRARAQHEGNVDAAGDAI